MLLEVNATNRSHSDVASRSACTDSSYGKRCSSNNGEWLCFVLLNQSCDVVSYAELVLRGSLPSTPASQIADGPTTPPALPLLPMKRPHQPVFEPESALRPTKKPRSMPKAEDKAPASKISRFYKACSQAQKIPLAHYKSAQCLQTSIPYINLLEVPQKTRKSSSSLRYTPIPQVDSSNPM